MPQNVYSLVQLAPGLGNSAFGFSSGRVSDGPGNTLGAVSFSDTTGTSWSDLVNIYVSVPSQINWTSSSGSWGTSGNWTVPGGSTHRVPLSSDTPSFNTAGGTVTLNGSQTVGSLWFNSTNSYTIAPGSGVLSLSNTGNAYIWVDAGSHTIAAPLSISGSLTVDTEPAASTVLTVSGQISGNSAVIKLGPGMLYLSNTNNTYNGNTSISGGTLVAAGGGSLGASGSVTISNATLDFSGPGTFSRNISLSGSGANTIQADAGIMTLSGTISGSGGLSKTGIGTLAVSNSGNSFSGGTNVLAGTLQLKAAKALSSTSAVTVYSGASLDLNGLSPTLANIFGGGGVTNGNAATSTLSAAYVSGAASYAAAIQGKIAVNVPAGGTLTLANSGNSYSGGTSLNGGRLSISSDGNLGAVPGSPASNLSLTGGTLQAIGSFAVNANRNVSIASNPIFDVAAGQSLAVGGVVAGNGGLTKRNNGMLVLQGANTYQGGTMINAGIVSVANDAALGDASGTVTINNGALEMQGDAASTRPIVVNSVSNSVVQVDSGTFTVAGAVSGSGVLSLQGKGTLSLTNPSNNYSGGTHVNGGTLLVNDPTGNLLGTGAVYINGGQVSGTGMISQQVNLSGGNLAPGTSSAIGTLSLSGGLQITGGSLTFKLQKNSTNCDALDFSSGTAGVSFVGSDTATVNLTGDPLPSTGNPYVLITGDYSYEGGGNTAVAKQLKLTCPLGYNGDWSTQFGNFGMGQYAKYAVTLTGPAQWQGSNGDAINDGSKWTGGISPANSVALFAGQGSGGTISVSIPSNGYSLHGLIFSNTTSSYSLTPAGTGALSLVGNTGTGQVEVVGGNHQILAAPKPQNPKTPKPLHTCIHIQCTPTHTEKTE